MVAYVIAIRNHTKDPAEMAAYRTAAQDVPRGVARPLAMYGDYKVLEGPHVEGVVLLEFPTMAEAKAFYETPAYRKATDHRLKGADYQFIIVQGL